MRKIIQIAVAYDSGDDGYQPGVDLYALCDDGTLWGLYRPPSEALWTRVKPIPQEPEPTPSRAERGEGRPTPTDGDPR